MKLFAFGIFIAILMFPLLAISSDEIAQAQTLINSNTACSSLTNDQLEIIGEYIMERMHPEDAHELMHKMMGLKEGSPEEKLFHINLAKSMYCGENGNYGMMGSNYRSTMMRAMMGFGNAGPTYGMMGQNYAIDQNYGSRGFGMMGNYGNGGFFGWNVFDILWLILLIGLIAVVYLHIWKKTSKPAGKERRK
ncbi:hypothetical protein HY989_05495 [Candidatus Micrarchaeota archaeon]|nr:hypothetical protein [Candidatus Micrarchaeota archaeon]